MGQLNGKVAVVTAASRGIGLAITKKYVDEGSIVYMAVRDSKKNRDLTDEMHQENDQYRRVIYDAMNMSTYEKMIEDVVDDAGHIDVLVNNFGTTNIQKDLTLLDGDPDTFFKITDVNIASVYYACRYAVKHMINQENGGSIVNISSVAGTTPDVSRLAYTTSKAAINSLTKNIAVQYARKNVRCNAILPGMVETDGVEQNLTPEFKQAFLKHVPLNRIAKPEDIADAAVYLASDNSSFVTGELIPVAGGFGLPTPIYSDSVDK